jgi:hypothetical protein
MVFIDFFSSQIPLISLLGIQLFLLLELFCVVGVGVRVNTELSQSSIGEFQVGEKNSSTLWS